MRSANKGDDPGIKRIGLRELSGGTGKIPGLARIDDRDREPGTSQGGGHGDFESASGLQDDEGRGQLPQLADQLLKTCAVALGCEALTGWADMNVETILRDVDADEARRRRMVFRYPSL
jgi:hypothetical protein